jgi:hypothetical protein
LYGFIFFPQAFFDNSFISIAQEWKASVAVESSRSRYRVGSPVLMVLGPAVTSHYNPGMFTVVDRHQLKSHTNQEFMRFNIEEPLGSFNFWEDSIRTGNDQSWSFTRFNSTILDLPPVLPDDLFLPNDCKGLLRMILGLKNTDPCETDQQQLCPWDRSFPGRFCGTAFHVQYASASSRVTAAKDETQILDFGCCVWPKAAWCAKSDPRSVRMDSNTSRCFRTMIPMTQVVEGRQSQSMSGREVELTICFQVSLTRAASRTMASWQSSIASGPGIRFKIADSLVISWLAWDFSTFPCRSPDGAPLCPSVCPMLCAEPPFITLLGMAFWMRCGRPDRGTVCEKGLRTVHSPLTRPFSTA